MIDLPGFTVGEFAAFPWPLYVEAIIWSRDRGRIVSVECLMMNRAYLEARLRHREARYARS